jgi:WD40 repeat protein
MRCASTVLTVCALSGIAGPGARAQGTPARDNLTGERVSLEQTYYYDGNSSANYLPPSIAVAADGMVAVAVNSSVGPGNRKNVHRRRVLLFDKHGNPVDRIHPENTVMRKVTFGPDGRIYTAEEWHGAGTHVYDRAGTSPRVVPLRFLKADGSDVGSGGPLAVAIAPDLLIYTINARHELCITSPEGKLVKTIAGSGHDLLRIGPDGTLYSGDKVLQSDDTWQPWDYFVQSVSPDGKLLVSRGNDWSIYDPIRKAVVRSVTLPPGNWAEYALGPDENIYLVPNNTAVPHASLETPPGTDAGLTYVVANLDGEILLRRGADFDRLKASMPKGRVESGSSLLIEAETKRSRDLGYLPRSAVMPGDNRPPIALSASMVPTVSDPLMPPAWQPIPLEPAGAHKYRLTLPEELVGEFKLRLAATSTSIPGAPPLAVESTITLLPADAAELVTPMTDRGRTGFLVGRPIRLTVPIRAPKAVDLRGAALTLSLDDQVAWRSALGLEKLAAGARRTAVITVPAGVTAKLRPGVYRAKIAGLPQGLASGSAVVALVDRVRRTDFNLPLHGLGNFATSYQDPVRDARLYAELGFTHVVSPEKWDGAFLDALTRLGLSFHLQTYGHFYPVELLPQEQGVARQQIAALAQKMRPYPAFRGFTYHDGINNPRWALGWFCGGEKEQAKHDALFAEKIGSVVVPPEVAAHQRNTYVRNAINAALLPNLYHALGTAIEQVDPALDRTTMQWWQAPLWLADADRTAPDQNLISTQHMEEQFYHPITVAHQADLWRRPDKPLWVYGNNNWQDDGTGASFHTDFMAALSRAVQGIGRTSTMPFVGSIPAEATDRAVKPALQLLRTCGGLSAVSTPADQVAIWRSFHQEALVPFHSTWARWHHFQTVAAYTACLYAHRPATIVTDERVRAGGLAGFKSVVVSFEAPPPADLRARLEEFRAGGGLVLANRPADGYWCPPGAIELGPAFGRSHADWEANKDTERHLGVEQDGLHGAEVMLRALAGHVQPIADCDAATTWLSVLKHGAAQYIYATNVKRLPQDPRDLHRYAGYESTRLPTRAEIRLRPGLGVVYDVLRCKPLATDDAAGSMIEADMSYFPGAVFAVLPAAIDKLTLSTGQNQDGGLLRYCVEVLDQQGHKIDAAVPLEITIDDAMERRRFRLLRTAQHGAWDETLPIAANDAPGRWTVAVVERLSGRRSEGRPTVKMPVLPRPAATPQVEWPQTERVREALKQAQRVALVIDDSQVRPLRGPIEVVRDWLAAQGKKIENVAADEYLADRQRLGWDRFHFGSPDRADIEARPAKYDLIVAFSTPELPNRVVDGDLLPIVPSSADPGPKRGIVEYAVMPVYDKEDAVVLVGGDTAGLLAAAQSLAAPDSQKEPAEEAPPSLRVLDAEESKVDCAGIRDFLGVPVGSLAASPDGKRIAAGLNGWGNNFVVLDADGHVLHAEPCGKLYPVNLQALTNGFTAVTHENDSTTLYLKMFDRDGKASRRIAAPGRRVGGVRDWSPSLPNPDVMMPFLEQASFSVTPDGRLAAAGGSRAIAVWDLKGGNVLWRDDTVHYAAVETQNTRAGPQELATSFPRVELSPDGTRLALHHRGTTTIRDARTGKLVESLPSGIGPGRLLNFDGTSLVGGNPYFPRPPFSEFVAFHKREPFWRWQSPQPITSTSFARDNLHYAVGEVDGTLRLMEGGGQIAGWVSPAGSISSVSIDRAGARVAFATTGGWLGVLDAQRGVIWQKDLGTRAVIALFGDQGETVAGDWRGFVRRFSAAGEQLWETDLTPQTWRDDLQTALTKPDTTPTLRLPAPNRAKVNVPAEAENLARGATVKLYRPKSWVGDDWTAAHETSLNDGKLDCSPDGWFSRLTVEFAAFVPSPPAWEFEWTRPVTLDTVAVFEAEDHAQAVPEELRIEAWIDGEWKDVCHEYWNRGVVHHHQFAPVTTDKLRYVPLGDLSRNVWLTEIEVYHATP